MFIILFFVRQLCDNLYFHHLFGQISRISKLVINKLIIQNFNIFLFKHSFVELVIIT
jgi:hypothetical protein